MTGSENKLRIKLKEKKIKNKNTASTIVIFANKKIYIFDATILSFHISAEGQN